MAWGRMDDTFHDHPKVEDLSLAAVGLWAKCWSKALRHVRTVSADRLGFVSEATARGYGGRHTPRLVAELTRALPGKKFGMWEPVEGGWMIHDFADYLPKRRDPEEAAESGRKGAQSKWAKQGKQIASSHSSSQQTASQEPQLEPGSQPDESMADGIANDGSRAYMRASPSRPVPSVVTSGGEGPETLHAANAQSPPPSKSTYVGHCPKHQHIADPPPCVDCRNERLRAEREADHRARELENAIRECPDCEGTGKVLAADKTPTRKTCTHPNVRRTA